MKVSIIIPVFNAEKYLSQCIDSVINQTYKNIEILLVNDGSTDNSNTICKEYEKIDKRVTYIYKDNGGVSSARNVGLKKAIGDFVFFLDSDDYLENDVIESLINNNSRNDILIGTKHKDLFHDRLESVKVCNNVETNNFIINLINGTSNGFIWGYLFNKKNAQKILFDENTGYIEDMIFLISYLNTFKIRQIKYIDSYYIYRIIDSSITRSNNNLVVKCNNILYSLDIINSLTNNVYYKEICNKKVRMIEGKLGTSANKKDYIDVINKVVIPQYNGNKFRFKIFSKLYLNKKINALCIYYFFKRLFKKLIKGR